MVLWIIIILLISTTIYNTIALRKNKKLINEIKNNTDQAITAISILTAKISTEKENGNPSEFILRQIELANKIEQNFNKIFSNITSKRRIGDILIEKGYVVPSDLEQALKEQAEG